jgi:hypothetical protein
MIHKLRYSKDPEMDCFSVIMRLTMKNCHRVIQQIIYQAAGITYRFSVVMCLTVKNCHGCLRQIVPRLQASFT